MAGNRDQDEARWTRFRAAELAAEPVAGHFDAAHLREINRRLFQDLPNLGYNDATPGEYRPPVEGNHDWYKTRALEGHAARPVVAYSRMDDSARQEIDRALRAAEPARLSPLATADFTDAIADLYTRLDYLHPFPDGNSRTLRMFTHQLAEASGFELDWSRFAQSGAGRNVLYVARDLSVNRLALDRIGSDETRRQVTLTLDQFDGSVSRVTPERRRRTEHPHEVDHRRCRLGQHAFEPSPQVLDVGDGDDRRLGFFVQVADEREESVVDVVDHHPVFDLVLGARLEGCSESGVVVDITGARRRAGQGV
jgi:cell filamentation protein